MKTDFFYDVVKEIGFLINGYLFNFHPGRLFWDGRIRVRVQLRSTCCSRNLFWIYPYRKNSYHRNWILYWGCSFYLGS